MDKTPEQIYLGFGSNLGDREDNLRLTLERLASAGCRILRVSGLYETQPWGGAEGDDYLNAVIELERQGSPLELLDELQRIETALGRTRERRYAPRTCDLDILLWGPMAVDEPRLRIPHEQLAERRFVLRPLCDLIPDHAHPVSGKSFRALLAAVKDDLEVRPLIRREEPAPL